MHMHVYYGSDINVQANNIAFSASATRNRYWKVSQSLVSCSLVPVSLVKMFLFFALAAVGGVGHLDHMGTLNHLTFLCLFKSQSPDIPSI